jgi:hypothetical protein
VDNDVLRQAPLFSALDDEAATALRASMSETRLRRGDVLFHEGDSGDKLYIVLDGKVKLGRSSSDGRENLLAILGPGQMFGELSLFDPGPRSATVTAVPRGPPALAGGPPGRRPGPAHPAGRPAPQGQRRRRRPGLLRRPRPRRQGAARPRRPLRPHRRRRRPRPPRPHPGGARPAGRRLPRDGQQGARRLRLARLAAPGAPLGGHHGRRATGPPRPLTAIAGRWLAVLQVRQLRAHRQLRRAPEHGVDVLVDDLDDLPWDLVRGDPFGVR